MKIILLLSLFVLIILDVKGQKRKSKTNSNISEYAIYVGKIKQSGNSRPARGPIVDTVLLSTTALKRKTLKLLEDIRTTGDDDVSKCFTPRDAIIVLKNDSLYATLLICYECDGFRLSYANENIQIASDEKKVIKNRLAQIKTAEAITSAVKR